MQTEKYDSQIEVAYEWWTRMQGHVCWATYDEAAQPPR